MFKPLPLYIGLRYTRAKRRNHFISFISLASMLGIALGVTVLITVLSVMNGFDYQIRHRFFAITPQVTVITKQDITQNWRQLLATVKTLPEVQGAAPYVSGNGMMIQGEQMAGVKLMGIDPQLERQVSQLANHMQIGKLDSLQSGDYHIVIGAALSDAFGLGVGDKINIFTPQSSVTLLGVFPRYKTFQITGIYHTTGGLYDTSMVFINMQDASTLFLLGQRESGAHVMLHRIYQAQTTTQQLQKKLSSDYEITNWTVQFGAFFQALAMEKTMLFAILLLIVAVAAFNLVSTLVMVVNDKRADIAILRTLGARPRTIMMTFIVQGAVVGLLGTVLGVLSGLLLASHVTAIVDYIQTIFHVQFIQSSIYFIDFLPSRIEVSDVFHVCLVAVGLSLLATLYPAYMAFRTQPAEALRYE